jgi:hypothetical protein
MPIAVFLCCIGWAFHFVASIRELRQKQTFSVQKSLTNFVPKPEKVMQP